MGGTQLRRKQGDPARAEYPKECAGYGCTKQLRNPHDLLGDWPGTVKEQSGGLCAKCVAVMRPGAARKQDGSDTDSRQQAAFAVAEHIRRSREQRGVRPQGGYYTQRMMAR